MPAGVASDVAAAQLRTQVRDRLNQGYDAVLINVGDLTYVDSTLLGAVVQAHLYAVRAGVTLRVLNATKRFRELLRMTKLDRVIAVTDSEPNP
jgi:anti-anti-sigma factor